jgi:hypothetical protein
MYLMVKTSSGSVAVTAIAIVAALLATSVVSSALVEPAYAKKAPVQKSFAYCTYYGDGGSTCSPTRQLCEEAREAIIAGGVLVPSECIKEKDFDWPP